MGKLIDDSRFVAVETRSIDAKATADSAKTTALNAKGTADTFAGRLDAVETSTGAALDAAEAADAKADTAINSASTAATTANQASVNASNAVAALTTKAPLVHQHAYTDITGLGSVVTHAATDFIEATKLGAANGVADLDGTGKVPAIRLPSYVDDVVDYANFAALPVTGETGKIYVTLDNNKQYRWSGSTYIELTQSPGSTDSIAEGSVNLYFTAARARAAVTNQAISFSALRVMGTTYPSVVWESTSNTAEQRKWQSFVSPDGAYHISPLNDAESTATDALTISRNGSVTLHYSLNVVAPAGQKPTVFFYEGTTIKWQLLHDATSGMGLWNEGQSEFAWSIPDATNVVKFANTPTVNGAPLAKASEVASLADIAMLAMTLADLQNSTVLAAGWWSESYDTLNTLDTGGIDSYVKLLLHGDGANNSTTFTDSSLTPHTMTAGGAAKISTTWAGAFGGSSMYFNGASYVSTPNTSDFAFGTGDFTIEARINPDIANPGCIVSNYGSPSVGWALQAVGGTLKLSWGDAVLAVVAWTATPGTTYHIACVRSSGVVTIWVNGAQVGSSTTATGDLTYTGGNLEVGRIATAAVANFSGYIEELRISKGIARWTAPFTPPAAAYSVVSVNIDVSEPGCIKNTVTPGMNEIPTMTSNGPQSGVTVSASVENVGGSSREAFRAFDDNVGTIWAANTLSTDWLKVAFSTAKTIVSYDVSALSGYQPTAWVLEASNDNSSWTAIDTRTGQSLTASTTYTYTVTTPGSYTYYRIRITAATGGAGIWQEINLYSAGIKNNVDIRFVPQNIGVVPTTLDIYAAVAQVDVLSWGTDFMIYGTRDNGTTWTQSGIITDLGTVGGFYRIIKATVVVSGQSSGQLVAPRFVSANNKSFKILGHYIAGRP